MSQQYEALDEALWAWPDNVGILPVEEASSAIQAFRTTEIERVTADWSDKHWDGYYAYKQAKAEQERLAQEAKLPLRQDEITGDQAKDTYTYIFGLAHSSRELSGPIKQIVTQNLMAVMRRAYPEHLSHFNPQNHFIQDGDPAQAS